MGVQVSPSAPNSSRANVSFPKWLPIDNKAHSVFVSLVLAIEDTGFYPELFRDA